MKPRNPRKVAAWNAGPGGAALAAINAHLGTALMAHGIGKFTQMRQACASLASDVKAARMGPAIPNTAMESLYKKALASLASGAASCEASISSNQEGLENSAIKKNSALLAAAVSELNVGIRELYSATAVVKMFKKPR